MPDIAEAGPRLLAISDLHVRYEDNHGLVSAMSAEVEGDWLVVAGDVGDTVSEFEWALRLLATRFEQVIWTPGNHDLWTMPDDPVQLRGVGRYEYLIELCRSLGVSTPEDPYPIWTGPGGPAIIAPLFTLYDYTFRPPGAGDHVGALEAGRQAAIICNDEFLLHPDPFPSRQAWCDHRVGLTVRRLEACDPSLPTILINHYPLIREPTKILRFPEFALWCGTERTADWHLRFRSLCNVYGHLHIPRTHEHDGVRFEEVSLGYPREWQGRPFRPRVPRQILPPPAAIGGHPRR